MAPVEKLRATYKRDPEAIKKALRELSKLLGVTPPPDDDVRDDLPKLEDLPKQFRRSPVVFPKT